MKLKTVPANHGVHWVRQGFFLFFRHPFSFVSLLASFILVAMALSLMPLLGYALVLATLPLLTLTFLLTSNMVVVGTAMPMWQVLLHPFRIEKHLTRALLWLGMLYAVTNGLAAMLSDALGTGQLHAFMEMLPNAKPEELTTKMADGNVAIDALLRMGLSTLVSIPFWHAPGLIYWDKQTCAQALFSSTLACWRNRGAFVVYGLTFLAVTVATSLTASLVFALLGQAPFFATAAVPLSLMLVTAFYASLYFTFVGCFTNGESEKID
jgi:hypothetical protein